MNVYCVRLKVSLNSYWMEDGRNTFKKNIKWFSIIHWTIRLNLSHVFKWVKLEFNN